MATYDPFAPDYDVWAADMTEDVQWYVSLTRDAADPVVELAVGSGRVAIPIARETGRRVVGRSRAGGLPVELREGDIRTFGLDEQVELVICPARSLLHLPTWADKRQTFERVAAALRPGGRFAFNLFAFSPTVAARVDGRREERDGGHWQVIENVPAESRIDITRGRGETTYGVISLWWATKSECEGLIDVAGLEVEALYGGFHREPYTDDSLEMVWVARRS